MGECVSVYGPAVGVNVVTNFPCGQLTDHQLFSAETVRTVVRTLCLPYITHLVCDCMQGKLFSHMLAVMYEAVEMCLCFGRYWSVALCRYNFSSCFK